MKKLGIIISHFLCLQIIISSCSFSNLKSKKMLSKNYKCLTESGKGFDKLALWDKEPKDFYTKIWTIPNDKTKYSWKMAISQTKLENNIDEFIMQDKSNSCVLNSVGRSLYLMGCNIDYLDFFKKTLRI